MPIVEKLSLKRKDSSSCNQFIFMHITDKCTERKIHFELFFINALFCNHPIALQRSSKSKIKDSSSFIIFINAHHISINLHKSRWKMLNKRFTLNEIQLVYILIVKVKMVDMKRQTYTNYN